VAEAGRGVSQSITVTDLFCGAGGSSIGAEAAGARLVMAANHWRLAIDTHNTNFPNADHDCADVSQVNPRRYPRTDVLIASPECTNHSSAKTRKVVSTIWDPNADAQEERSRATMWDVPRFAEHHRYELVIVENVVEARRWAPFDAWLASMHALGYEHRAVYLNSMVAHPTPQSRDRMYVVFWQRGNRAPDLEFHPIAHCVVHGDVAAVQSWKNPVRPFGKYRAQYVYRCPVCTAIALPYAWPAAAAIDWSLPAPRIGDRARPLADATMRRIRAGLDRYGPSAIVQAAGHTFERPGYYRTWPTWEPLGTQTTGSDHHSLITTPFLTDYHGEGNPQPVGEPHRTMDTRDRYGLVEPSIDVEDCGFRMLEPHEIGRAMAFDDSYIVLGNKRERVRQYGNAVTPPVMAMILGRAIGSLSGERVA
jgi:DNA (cytosine-5)-methyltransferase 1